MVTALARVQAEDRGVVNALQLRASFAGGSHGSVIKFFRLALQSGALAIGAVLVIAGSISAGSMIVASLLMARALSPVEQIVQSWRQIIQVRIAAAKLNALLADFKDAQRMSLPAPSGAVVVERLSVCAPQTGRAVLTCMDILVEAGEIIGVVGASGAGKSTLLGTLAGAYEPAEGYVRFDGASRTDWDSEKLARYVGYLPQEFVLFPGTVKENIAHFAGRLEEDSVSIDAAVIAAAQAIGAHDMILRLPDGYDTAVGPGGTGLSAGQTQRIAIARALFGDPAIVLLDEPTAHLDADGQRAFLALLGQLRRRGATLIVASHSTELLAAVDKLLVLSDGRASRFGPVVEARGVTPRRSNHLTVPVTYASWKV